jgi:tetratricopeptide (TPR) repeat protein
MNRCLLRLAAIFFLSSASIALWTPSSVAQATPVEANDEEARSLFEAGRSAYGDGRFEEALGHFRRSYELSHRPQLLYNIGQCQDRLRRDAEALATFEEFLTLLPESPQHTEVAARIEILRAAIERGEASEAVAETEAETEVTEAPVAPVLPSEPDPAPWIVLGVGGAVAVAGAILLGVGYANVATVEGAMNVPFSSVRGAYDSAPALTGAGWAALGLGVALAGVGLVWGLSSGGGGNEHAHLRMGPTGISVSGSF